MTSNFKYPKATDWLDPAACRTRRFPRVEVGGTVILTNGLELLYGSIHNLSIGGFAASMSRVPDPGTVWKVVIRLDGGDAITPAQAITVRSGDRNLVALEFTAISNHHRLLISELVASKLMEKTVGAASIAWRNF